ncbi:MAG: DUF362 domain-containing protein [Polyangiaceae bacterium]|nr:DUF362 domain-containing protein [Polyangiaceae bacterium]
MSSSLTRRHLLGATAASAAALAWPTLAHAGKHAASPPAGFLRASLPGKVVRASQASTLQANGLWPEPASAKALVGKAMEMLTGTSDLGRAFGMFVHPEDRVALKPNGIAGRKGATMATNKELVLEVVRGVLAAGVPPERITIFEQYRDFLYGTRVITDKDKLTLDPDFPAGIRTAVHLNKDAAMEEIMVGGTPTRYVRPFTEATVVINLCLMKDHGICGFTGALKNITHGCNVNPQDFHAHNASPQIAHLYAQEVVKSRVALHITDAFKVIYDGGPLDTKPSARVPFHSVYAATDPVALDVIGWELIERLRKDNGLPTLAAAGREPTYIRTAADLGLGVYDRANIALTEATV